MSAEPHTVYREHARRMVAEGLTDQEIGHLIVVSYDAEVRPSVWKYVFEARDALNPAGMTDEQKRKVGEIRTLVAELRRNRQAVNKSIVAQRVGIDRGTLARWIGWGWVTLD